MKGQCLEDSQSHTFFDLAGMLFKILQINILNSF